MYVEYLCYIEHRYHFTIPFDYLLRVPYDVIYILDEHQIFKLNVICCTCTWIGRLPMII